MTLRTALAGLQGAVLFIMFSYKLGANPQIDFVRLLISDTQGPQDNCIFQDEEIVMATTLQSQQFQSSMTYSYPAGQNLPSSPVSYLRVAAMLLDCIASNKARLASIQQLLDVKLDPQRAAQSLQAQANEYRKIDDEAGAFMIIEQCNDQWSFQKRFWAQVQRQSGGGN